MKKYEVRGGNTIRNTKLEDGDLIKRTENNTEIKIEYFPEVMVGNVMTDFNTEVEDTWKNDGMEWWEEALKIKKWKKTA